LFVQASASVFSLRKSLRGANPYSSTYDLGGAAEPGLMGRNHHHRRNHHHHFYWWVNILCKINLM
jgi:hypothetical protein